ncbi:MAG: hypothetical protein M0Z33_09850 [Actinomycetota bacterium]|nr:hypothetical protein [Actinomycetota bacterium]
MTTREPTIEEVTRAIAEHVAPNGTVRPGIADELAAAAGWHGRVVDVLALLTTDADRMGYLAGGLAPDEVASWLARWCDSPFSLDELRAIVSSAGWDPEPFVVVVRNGLLDRLVHLPDGTLRRVGGELAGAWLSDEHASSEEDAILAAVRRLVEADPEPSETS